MISWKGISNHLQKAFFDTLITWKNEFYSIFKDGGVLVIFIIAPILYPMLYAWLYNPEVTQDVPMVVVDPINDKDTRTFRRMVDATKDIKIVGICANMEEAKEALKEKKAFSILEFDRNYSKDIMHYKQGQVNLYCDMSSMLYYKGALIALTAVSQQLDAKIMQQRLYSLSKREMEISQAPLKYEEVFLYNPQNGYGSFLIPSVLILIIQQLILLGIGMRTGTDRDQNKFADLIPIQQERSGTFRIIFGKALAYSMIWSILVIWLLWIVPDIFVLPKIGDAMTLVAFFLPFLIDCTFFGMAFSALVRDRESVFVVVVSLSVVLLFMSGISWPRTSIPDVWRYISYILPSTAGINAYVKLNSMGGTLANVKYEYLTILIQTFVYVIITWFVYRKAIIDSKKEI